MGASGRVAMFLDVENLIHEYRETADWPGAALTVTSLVHSVAALGTIISCVAACDRGLARHLALLVAPAGVRTFPHFGGPGAADHALLARIHYDLPESCDTIVIGSGDHIFAPVIESLVAAGKRVVVVAKAGRIAQAVRSAASHVMEMDTAERALAALVESNRATSVNRETSNG